MSDRKGGSTSSFSTDARQAPSAGRSPSVGHPQTARTPDGAEGAMFKQGAQKRPFKRSGWRRRGSESKLSDLLPSVLPRNSRSLSIYPILVHWRKCVPARVALHAHPVELQHGTLKVHTRNNLWAYELQFLRQSILQTLQRQAPALQLRDIRFVPGPLPERRQLDRDKLDRDKLDRDKLDPPSSATASGTKPPLTATMDADFARSLAHIRDDDVRNAVICAAATARVEMWDR